MWEKTVIRKAMKYVNLDFGGNEYVAKAYRESDKDVEFNKNEVVDVEVVEQKDVFETQTSLDDL